MNRRDLLKGIVLFGAAPAIVRAESLMKLWVPARQPMDLWVGEWGTGIATFPSITEAMKRAIKGDRIMVSGITVTGDPYEIARREKKISQWEFRNCLIDLRDPVNSIRNDKAQRGVIHAEP